MFKLFVLLAALVAFAFAAPKAAPQIIYSGLGYGGQPGYAPAAYGYGAGYGYGGYGYGGYAAPTVYGGVPATYGYY